jgi:hypothetical protein
MAYIMQLGFGAGIGVYCGFLSECAPGAGAAKIARNYVVA